jgi:small subunit ribosomal protein S2
MRDLQKMRDDGSIDSVGKKEGARLRRELTKLERNLSGIAEMADLPGALFVVDINRESIAVAEANRLNIPVVAIVDTNCDPGPIDYPIPGNDDAIRAIQLIINLLSDTLQQASNEYAKVLAEEARRRAREEAEAKAKAAKAEAERIVREEAEKKEREAAAKKAKEEAEAKAKADEATAKAAKAAEAAAKKTAPKAEKPAAEAAEPAAPADDKPEKAEPEAAAPAPDETTADETKTDDKPEASS